MWRRRERLSEPVVVVLARGQPRRCARVCAAWFSCPVLSWLRRRLHRRLRDGGLVHRRRHGRRRRRRLVGRIRRGDGGGVRRRRVPRRRYAGMLLHRAGRNARSLVAARWRGSLRAVSARTGCCNVAYGRLGQVPDAAILGILLVCGTLLAADQVPRARERDALHRHTGLLTGRAALHDIPAVAILVLLDDESLDAGRRAQHARRHRTARAAAPEGCLHLTGEILPQGGAGHGWIQPVWRSDSL